MATSSLTGLLCRILLLTSVAYEDTNEVTVEFSTPRTIKPDSMFFCFANTKVNLTQDTLTVRYVTEGGDIFTVSDTLVAATADPGSDFFGSGTGDLNGQEISTVYEVLGTDPFYARSYLTQRYDDLVKDQDGQPIRGVAAFPINMTAKAVWVPEQQGNCFLLTGKWKPNTRYQMAVSFRNPPMPPAEEVPFPPPPPSIAPPQPPQSNASSGPPPLNAASIPPQAPPANNSMLVVNNATPILWVAPVSYSVQTWRYGNDSGSTLLFSVRGDKYGAACPLRDNIVPYMSTMFDPCTETRKLGAGPAEGANVTSADCLALLQQLAVDPALRGSPPFTLPPLTPYTLSSLPDTTCLEPNTVLGPRFGGECVKCGTYGVKEASSCSCPDTVLPNLVGDVACGQTVSPDGTVSRLGNLTAWLCSTYTTAQQQWLEKDLLDHNVVKLYLEAFLEQASPLLDETVISAAHKTFQDTLVFDDRRPDSPTRRLGLKPNCNKCTDGVFTDQYTATKRPLFDYHFDAMNTFRFIGYLLDQALGWPCPALWDSANPRQWGYGYYDQIICKLIPDDTWAGPNNSPDFVQPSPPPSASPPPQADWSG